MRRWYFLYLAAIPLLLNFSHPPSRMELTWWTTHALDKVRPYDAGPTDGQHGIKIQAARNEFEPFQVVLRAVSQDAEAVDINVTDLRGANGVIPSQTCVSVYIERYFDLKKPSGSDGATGEWPDPLIPQIDRYKHEKRNAFPFQLTKHRNQPVWVEVYVPPHTPAGSYHGEVQVSIAGERRISIPVDLEVWNFDLPSTSSLVTTFGFSGNTAVRQHFGRYTSDKDIADITSLYQKSGLWHRITMDGSSGSHPLVVSSGGRPAIQWDAYDAQIGPLMDGLVFSRGEPLYGARATSVAVHRPPSLTEPAQQIQYWREAVIHFRQKGWMDRLFLYLWDEPKESQYSKMIELGRTVRRAAPELKILVTAPLHPEWQDFVDIWTPTINCLERKPPHGDYCTPAVDRTGYNAELGRGKQLWWYQACNTHSCNGVGGDYFTGWPSYMIDHDGVRNRIMAWMTWKYNIGGELYFSTNEAYASKDPWKDVYLFGGNGDGTLFYPGRPDVIGGRTHIPIESIRLKLIREGLEDYEYLVLLNKLGGSQSATKAVNSFIRHLYDFDSSPERLYAIRESIATEILRRMGTSAPRR
jgi:Domain of unknown function (DUF4091)